MIYTLSERMIFKPIKIALVGCGGTGSFLFRELLALNSLLRQIEHNGLIITAYDPSIVRDANIGRQCFASHEVGKNKAQALVSHEHQLGHCLDWTWRAEEFKPADANHYDIIITAVDHPYVRYQIGNHFKDSKLANPILWLDVGNSEYLGQILLGELGSEESKVLPNCYDLWGDTYNQPDFVNTKSCSLHDALLKQRFGVNQTAARCSVQLLTNLILTGETNYHGVYFDTKNQTQDPIEINTEQWALMGYSQQSDKNNKIMS